MVIRSRFEAHGQDLLRGIVPMTFAPLSWAEQPDTRERVAAIGMTIEGATAERLAAFIATEKARLGTLIRVGKIRVE